MWAWRDVGRGQSFQRVFIVRSKLVHWCGWSWCQLGWRLDFIPVTAGHMVNPIRQLLGVILKKATAVPQTFTRDCLQTQYWDAQTFLLLFSARRNEPSRFTESGHKEQHSWKGHRRTWDHEGSDGKSIPFTTSWLETWEWVMNPHSFSGCSHVCLLPSEFRSHPYSGDFNLNRAWGEKTGSWVLDS